MRAPDCIAPCLFVEIGHCHVRSFAREQHGDSTADADLR
jgi:hypothetical protein